MATMSPSESAPREQTDPEAVVLVIDALQHEAGFDLSGSIPEKITRFEALVQKELKTSESNTVEIVAGNVALTLAAAIETADAGAEEIQLVDPHNGNSVCFGPEGTILGSEGGGTIEISLGSHEQLPSKVDVIPVNFINRDVDEEALTPVSMANSATVGIVPEDPAKVPDIRFTGQIGEFSEDSIVHFEHNDPMLGVMAGGIRWANLRRKGLIKGSLEINSGGRGDFLTRVVAGVRTGDIAYGGGD